MLERGDGLEAESPSPFCFAVEHTREEPVEAAAWVGAISLAFLLPLVFGRRRGDENDNDAEDDAEVAGADELILSPCRDDIAEPHWLADLVPSLTCTPRLGPRRHYSRVA